MQLILPLVYSLLFILLIFKVRFFTIDNISKTKLTLLFLLKLITGTIVWLVYTRHYSTADFQTYFSDSKILIEQLCGNNNSSGQMLGWNTEFETTLFNNSRTMIIVNAVIQIFSFGNFFVHIVFFCFFSFIGQTALYKAFVHFFPAKNMQLIIAVFLIPTILFWSSAVSKESLTITIIGLIMYISSFGLKLKYTSKEFVMLLMLLLFLVFVKIYAAIALLPVLAVNTIVARTSNNKLIFKYILILSAAFIISFLIKSINPDYNVLKLISDKQSKAISEAKGGIFLANDKNFICIDYYRSQDMLIAQSDSIYKVREGASYLSWKLNNMKDTTFMINAKDTAAYKLFYTVQPANTVLEIKRLKPDWVDFIVYSPRGVLNVLFQPTLFNVTSWLHLAAAIENLWLLLIIILAAVFFDKTVTSKKEIIGFALLFSMILFILIGITTPVVGAMIRYRTVGLLFFAPVILIFIDENKIRERLFKRKKL